MKKKNNYLGLLVAIILVVILSNPSILPLPTSFIAYVKDTMSNSMPFVVFDNNILAKLIVLLLMLSVMYVITSILKIIINKLASTNKRGLTVSQLLLSILRYLTVIVGAVWALAILGVNVSAILASLGIAGLILGFGAQSLIEDVITGIFIIFEGQYDIGDIIVLDDLRGKVVRIGVRTTTIQDDGGNLKIVNNSDIRNLQNRSVNHSLAITTCEVHYNTDLSFVDKVLKENLPKLKDKHLDLYLSVPEFMGVEGLNASGVELKFKVLVEEANVFAAKRELNRDIFEIFTANNIEIPFPQVVVTRAN